ncbi:hypothetical protein VRU48_16555 [Pedobacter sp. KR3-3]|uniref:Uncharacterized protein n=1 Tax=Pedobacter albus TaxID=3113905 RepID=A0ABU7IB84_9SPHI|nr:hypothetical protein [Pedobacter sp. KR3-3]MEE1946737.1 hypothetical protein [Pedobacter sp. KR3-3]
MPSEKTYELNGFSLPVVFKDGVIQINGPEDLQRFLSADIDNRTLVLVALIKSDYLLRTNQALAIEDDSMIVEIWGHVYASHFAEALKNLVQMHLIEQMADFIIHRADTIDCGERDKDNNRVFWDLLSNFKGLILEFLPNELKA